MQYVLLLRGINVGGKHKVSMQELRARMAREGFRDVRTYINSGNVLFAAEENVQAVDARLAHMLEACPFPILHALLTREDYLKEAARLPGWWRKGFARRDVLFYTAAADKAFVEARIRAMPLHDELVHFGEGAVFWGKRTEKEYLRTAYHRLLLKESFYPLVTIRNGRTFDKILELLG